MNKIKKQEIETGIPSKIKNGCFLLVSSLLIILSIGLVSAFADVTQIKAPLFWYEGGSGDYALPRLVNAEYDLSGFVATEGQVKTICANYDAVGAVAVEVSADNGLHYYSVTNGVPLTDKFVSGDRIKWRAKILDEDAKLNALSITYTDSAGTISSFGHEELSGFNYRKEILLKNPSGQELFNYQIKLKVGIDKKVEGADVNCEGNVRPDFRDVRFTAADGETPLSYYFENQIASSPAAFRNDTGSFWVKIPQITRVGVKIYIYYGNSNAGDLSDPKNTFDFYGSFKNTKLDASSWTVNADPKGSYAIKDGQLKLDAAEIIAKDFKFGQGIIEYSVSVESGFENSLSLRPKSGDRYDSPGLVAYSSVYKGAEHCIAIDDIVKANDGLATPITAGGKYNYRLTVDGNDITFERMDQLNTTVQAKVTYSDTSAMKAGYLGLKSGGDGSGRNVMAYSEIRVRKFVKAQPLVNKTGALEQVRLPIFSNTALSKEGNLILYDNTQAGTYITKTIPAPFNVRIIAPVYKGANLQVNVSADNGKNYKEDCLSGNYYYSSIKDFIAGENVVAKIKLNPVDVKKEISQLEEIKLNYNPGAVLMVKPNGAEKFSAGATEKISWSALDYDNKYPIKLEYSLDSGKNYSIITDNVSNSGSYSWKVPLDAKTKTALIRVSDSNDESINDVSDNVFTIQDAGLAAEEPAEETAQVAEETKDEETAQKQTKSELNDLDKDYVIDKNITISTDSDIAFKTLTLGDGKGAHISKIILNNNINPNSGKIIIRNGGQLIQANNDAQAISGDLIIEQGGILTHMENKTDKKYQLDLTAQNITLKSGAIVSAYAKGYSGGEAQQAGAGKAAGVYIGKQARGGKHTYDTEKAPNELGSGGAGSLLAKGGAGGGTIRLIAKQEFSLSGIINADGKAGAVASDNIYNAAGGAGGSIYLEASKFSGSGAKITASGGSGNKTAGAGGGGRINIKAPAGKISGTINANGGSGLNTEAGSVIIE
ncbi:MAG: DUF2341 domain-containing protein [Candidatus Omnitrophica bacterium]|nr:DUF2341 domain-containing protein [Candidatus Omnitrophota bacterium]